MIVRDFDDMRIGTTPLSKLYYGHDLIWKRKDEDGAVIDNKISSVYLTNYSATHTDYRDDGKFIVAAMEGLTGSLSYHIFIIKVTNGSLSLWYRLKTSGNNGSIAFSKDGEYLFIRNRNGNYFDTFVYKITSTGIVRDNVVENNLHIALSGTHRFKFSKDGNYIIAHGQSVVKFLKYIDGEFVLIHEERLRLVDYSNIVSKSLCLSSDGSYGVITLYNPYSGLGDVYKRMGENYSFYTTLKTSSNVKSSCCSFSPNDKFLAFGRDTAYTNDALLVIFKNDNGNFTRITSIDVIPSSSVWDITFSNDSKYMYILMSSNPFVMVYRIDGETFKKMPDPIDLPDSPSCIAVSPDDKHIVMIGKYAELYETKP